jgi:hypothetical protein
MVDTLELPAGLADQLRMQPIHTVLIELAKAAKENKVLATAEYRKLVAYLMETADGRDRREPWVNQPNAVRPTPKLRVAIEKCFGRYADLHWYRVNKTTNASGKPLAGLFPRMAAALSRVDAADFAEFQTALMTQAPDAALLRLLQQRGGKIKGVGVELFSRVAFAIRRDLFFPIPRPWGETSGCLEFIGDDLRKYCGLCRNLRAVCDSLGIPADVRGSVFLHLLTQKKPPPVLLEALHKAMGPSLARFSGLKSGEAYELKHGEDDLSALPVEFASQMIRGRRGRRQLRDALLRVYGERCAISGDCVRDLLEAAYLAPFPDGDVHAPSNAMLMRADLHTLWDLNMIGVEPGTMQVFVAPRLMETPYGRLAGRTALAGLPQVKVSKTALRERWRMYSSAHRQKADDAEANSSPEASPVEVLTKEAEADESSVNA